MTWLVTGGCGFLGTNLTDDLLSDGINVVVLDNLSRHGTRDNLEWLRTRHGSDWRFEEMDIRDGDAVARLIDNVRPEAIAHLAGQVAMTTSLQNPRLDFEVNALGTLNVLEAVRLHSLESMVLYSSTNKVYGALDQLTYRETATRYELPDFPHGLDETLPLDGCSPYGCSKLAGEQYCRDYHRSFGLKTAVFRHSSMFGGRQYATYDQGWVGWFCRQALDQQEGAVGRFTISGDGKQVRDVLHVSDLIPLYRTAGTRGEEIAGRIYNIGGGIQNSLSLLELFDMLERMLDVKLAHNRLAWRPGDQKVFVANNGQITTDLGWAPTISKDEGVAMMISWCKEVEAIHGLK
ncbi:MAG: GDP-mannose 4,6-dehydratase [Planctomycetes bacterium]|nr:GDP-mannose 4,6-dehydratase [Planctomycetota bacterium]